MDFKKVDKKILVLVLVLIVIAGAFWSRDWLKSIVSRVNLFQAQVSPELLPSEELGEVNLENLLPKEEPLSGISKEEAAEKAEEGAEIGTRQLSLEEIREEINRIRGEVEEVRQKVNKLEALTKIQKDINNIRKETELVRQEVNKLRNLVEIQEKIDEISEKTIVLTNVLAVVPTIKEIPERRFLAKKS